MRTLVIGDIHGGVKALEQVLERSGFDNSVDKLICLGDYVDGWSESAEVVQKLIELQIESEDRHIFIRGNHDEWCNEWFKTGARHKIWVNQGGATTIESYTKSGYIVDKRHHMFFYKLHNYYVDEKGRAFVHGGFSSRKGLGHESYDADYYWDRDLWNLVLMADGKSSTIGGFTSPSSSRYKKHEEIYIGHTATTNWSYKHNGVLRIKDTTNPDCKVGKRITTPIQACNVWNMDTGGGFGGKLTIMDIDTKKYWQSDLLTDLYPDERGR